MKENLDNLLRKIDTLQRIIEMQVPLESTVVFGEFNDQPMRSVWTDDDMEILKTKMKDLIKAL